MAAVIPMISPLVSSVREIGEQNDERAKRDSGRHRGNGLFAFPTEFKIGQIKIGRNCWVASNVTILNNVTIGDNVIVGAGCLIHKAVPSNTIVMRKEELIFKQAIRFVAAVSPPPCDASVGGGSPRPTYRSGIPLVADENPVFGSPE